MPLMLRSTLVLVLFLVLVLASAQPIAAGAPGPEEEPIEASAATPTAGSGPLGARPGPATPPIPGSPPTRDVSDPFAPRPSKRPVLDPSARLLDGDEATESWTLFFELASGHRISQRFLLSNAGPGKHNAVAVGHLVEPGRAPYRYVNGRRRARWTLSDDRLFFDIAASHLDLHRPEAELRISKDDIEIQLFFAMPAAGPSAAVAAERLPGGYHVEALAVASPTRGTLRAPWMEAPIETTGRAWLVHTWLDDQEADLLARRIELYAYDADRKTSFYGIHLRGNGDWESGWGMIVGADGRIIESAINVPARWVERPAESRGGGDAPYAPPGGFEVHEGPFSGPITLAREWLRFDPLEVIPQPFRWFVRMRSKPQEVWADARIGVSLSPASPYPPLPRTGERESARNEGVDGGHPAGRDFRSNSKRETAEETPDRGADGANTDVSVEGVASITFLNPSDRR